jgi:membrane-associated phospholipid phosphatase
MQMHTSRRSRFAVRPRLWVVVVLLVCMPAQAQEQSGGAAYCEPGSSHPTFDRRGLAAVYCTDSAIAKGVLKGAHATSYLVFYGAVPAAWTGAVLRGEGGAGDAYRLTLTQLVTYGTTVGLKRAVGRPRPFVTLPLQSRAGRSAEDLGRFESFPSGHASLSVALATSWSLSHPRWYVIAPSAAWAGAVTVSRLYLGVHYPSDVLTGAVLGATVATAIHLLRDALTPSALEPSGPQLEAPAIGFTVRF